jgi:hypothetical protein
MVKKQVFRHPILTQLQIKFSLCLCNWAQGQKSSIQKIGGYTVSLNHDNGNRCWRSHTSYPLTLGYDQLLQDQIDAWAKIWDMSDITIDGDVKHNKEFVSIFFNWPNVFRKRFSIKYWTRIYWWKIWRIYLLGYRGHIVFRFTWQPKTKKLETYWRTATIN